MNENVALKDGYTQVCVWPGTVVGKQVNDFIEWLQTEFGVRGQYLEEITTNPDETGPGGRNDLFFAIHNEDTNKFAVPRLQYGIRWIEDVYGNNQGCLYPARVADYQSWPLEPMNDDSDAQNESYWEDDEI